MNTINEIWDTYRGCWNEPNSIHRTQKLQTIGKRTKDLTPAIMKLEYSLQEWLNKAEQRKTT